MSLTSGLYAAIHCTLVDDELRRMNQNPRFREAMRKPLAERATRMCGACGGSGRTTKAEPVILAGFPLITTTRYRSTECSVCKGKGEH